MKCGNCPKTDGLCYTSLPPKVKCTITGKFHGYNDECDAGIIINTDTGTIVKPTLGTYCIVCNESIELTAEEEEAVYSGHRINCKVCDKCKQAIMYVRNNYLDLK